MAFIEELVQREALEIALNSLEPVKLSSRRNFPWFSVS
jgi:hypothetical protein